MTIEYDEKGKYYTDVITKIAVPAMIQTTTNLIRGVIHVRRDARLKDELETNEHFLAVTDISISDTQGKTIFSAPFLAVQKEQIVWVMPIKDENETDGAS